MGVDPEMLGQSESMFSLSNGHMGIRGNLDERDPAEPPGKYLNSCCQFRPLPYAGAGYGYPESGQTVVNVTDGKVIRLLVDNEPFDLRYGKITHHVGILDLRAGLLHRSVEWILPSGRCPPLASFHIVLARERAQTFRLKGAAFAWRTRRKRECSGYWPTGTAAMHINADIAAAAIRLVRWTGDTKFEGEVALPLLVETARLWLSLG